MYVDDIKEMVGQTFTRVESFKGGYSEQIVFTKEDGTMYSFYHDQDCCESVTIEDICGELDDLVGSPLLIASERTNHESNNEYESCTWTFYEFATIKGSVTVRWFGESNGYYGEEVSLHKTQIKGPKQNQ